MIVVMLIAVLYGVFISRMSTKGPEDLKDAVSLKTLKTFLLQFPAEKSRELVCPEPCKTCRVYIDGSEVQNLEIPLFKSEPFVYVRDRFGQYRQKTFLPIYDENEDATNLCFRFEVFQNKSSSHYIVQADDTHFYVFKPYMAPVSETDTLDAAQQAFDSEPLLPTEQRNYTY